MSYRKDNDMYPIFKDEVLFWHDILNDNSPENIAKETGIGRDRVRKIIKQRNEDLKYS